MLLLVYAFSCIARCSRDAAFVLFYGCWCGFGERETPEFSEETLSKDLDEIWIYVDVCFFWVREEKKQIQIYGD